MHATSNFSYVGSTRILILTVEGYTKEKAISRSCTWQTDQVTACTSASLENFLIKRRVVIPRGKSRTPAEIHNF